MLHLLPDSISEPRPAAYAEAVSRLAAVRHALRLVDVIGAGPEDDLDGGRSLANAWNEASEAQQRCFDRRSERLVGAAAAGIETLLDARKFGRAPHQAASQKLIDDIRRELADVARVVAR